MVTLRCGKSHPYGVFRTRMPAGDAFGFLGMVSLDGKVFWGATDAYACGRGICGYSGVGKGTVTTIGRNTKNDAYGR